MQTTAQALVDRLRQEAAAFPPMLDTITMGQAIGFAKTLAQGQPDRSRILREGVGATARELRDAPGTLF
jgi:hypothetical protein